MKKVSKSVAWCVSKGYAQVHLCGSVHVCVGGEKVHYMSVYVQK